jgi:hypothetical protein
MWGWIYPLLTAVMDWLKKQSDVKGKIEDVSTPDSIRKRWAAYVADRVRSRRGRD